MIEGRKNVVFKGKLGGNGCWVSKNNRCLFFVFIFKIKDFNTWRMKKRIFWMV